MSIESHPPESWSQLRLKWAVSENESADIMPMSWREHYPFESNYFSIGEHRMHYVDESDGDVDSVLLMVHGNPTWSFYYREVIKAFCKKRRCIAPDHVGMGLSDKPNVDYHLAYHIDNLCQLIQHLDLKRIHLMVHDWGGAIGLGAALEMPERFEALTITNTAAFPPPYVPARISVCRWPLLGPVLMKGLNVFPRAAVKMATEQKGGLDKSIANGFVHPYDCWANRVAVNAFVKDIPTSENDRTWKKLSETEQGLSRLSALPCQLIWGMKDWCFRPECLAKFQELLPDSQVTELANAGHYVNEDATAELLQSMSQFMETHGDAGR